MILRNSSADQEVFKLKKALEGMKKRGIKPKMPTLNWFPTIEI